MATTIQQLKQLEKEVRRLKTESIKMRRALRERGILPTPNVSRARARKMTERERVDEILRAAGLLGKPTAKEKQLIAEWNAIPTEERTRLVEEFRTAKFDKPLSEIVIENRR